MEPVQVILIIAGIFAVLVVLSALMSLGRRRGEKRLHDNRQAADGDATAQNPDEDPRHP